MSNIKDRLDTYHKRERELNVDKEIDKDNEKYFNRKLEHYKLYRDVTYEHKKKSENC